MAATTEGCNAAGVKKGHLGIPEAVFVVQLRRSQPHRFYSPPIPALGPSADAAKRLSYSSSATKTKSNTRKARPLSTPLPTRGLGLHVRAARPLSCTSPTSTLETSSVATRPSSTPPLIQRATSPPHAPEPSTSAARRLSGSSSPPRGPVATVPSSSAAKRLSSSSPPLGSLPKTGSPRKLSVSSTHGKTPRTEKNRQLPPTPKREHAPSAKPIQSITPSPSMRRLSSDAVDGPEKCISMSTSGARPVVATGRKLLNSSSSSPRGLVSSEGSVGQRRVSSPVNGPGSNKSEIRNLSTSSVCKLRSVKGRSKQVSFSIPQAGLYSNAGATIQPITVKPKMGLPVKVSASTQYGGVVTTQLSSTSIPHKSEPLATESTQASTSSPPTLRKYQEEAEESAPPSSLKEQRPSLIDARQPSSSSVQLKVEADLGEEEKPSSTAEHHGTGPAPGPAIHLFAPSTEHSYGLRHRGSGVSLSTGVSKSDTPGEETDLLAAYSSQYQLHHGSAEPRLLSTVSSQHRRWHEVEETDLDPVSLPQKRIECGLGDTELLSTSSSHLRLTRGLGEVTPLPAAAAPHGLECELGEPGLLSIPLPRKRFEHVVGDTGLLSMFSSQYRAGYGFREKVLLSTSAAHRRQKVGAASWRAGSSVEHRLAHGLEEKELLQDSSLQHKPGTGSYLQYRLVHGLEEKVPLPDSTPQQRLGSVVREPGLRATSAPQRVFMHEFREGRLLTDSTSQLRMRSRIGEVRLLRETSSQQGLGPNLGILRKRLSSSAQQSTDQEAFSSAIQGRMGSTPAVTWRFCGSSPAQRLGHSVGTQNKMPSTTSSHVLWPAAKEVCYSPPFKLEPSAVAAKRLSSFSAQCGGKK